jgi:hypothetical protein
MYWFVSEDCGVANLARDQIESTRHRRNVGRH